MLFEPRLQWPNAQWYSASDHSKVLRSVHVLLQHFKKEGEKLQPSHKRSLWEYAMMTGLLGNVSIGTL